MSHNFIVSTYRKAWIAGAKRLFIAEPFVSHVMERDGELQNYEEIQVAPPLWQSRDDLKQAHDFVDQKYHKYIPLLATRLNAIHNKNYDALFWKKCFSLGLLRYVTFIYQMFQLCETYFHPDRHDCRVLSSESYYVPSSFNDQRLFFEATAYGQEQLFSIYANLFYPGRFATFDDQFDWNSPSQGRNLIGRLSRITPEKILGRLSRITPDNALRRLYSFQSPRSVNIGIMCCSFAERYVTELVAKSKGRIRPIPLKVDFACTTWVDWEKRKTLSITDGGFDKFDSLFFTSLQHCMPREFVEDFEGITSYYTDYFKQYQNLKFVVSEWWIGNTYASIALALLQERGIKHIYNEHNYLSHQFLGSNSKYLFPLVDSFVTLGWDDKRIPNLIKGGSLFEWVLNKDFPKEYGILFVSGGSGVKAPEFNAAYGNYGAFGAQRYLEFNALFFKHLGRDTRQSIVFRGYPQRDRVYSLEPPMAVYDEYHVLKEYLAQCKKFDNVSPSAKALMLKSRLVIVNYLSTSYIEALLADVPSMFFWIKEGFHLADEYLDFYEPLVSVGICQTDPIQAARFVERIKDDPEKWWQSKPVQEAKESFLSQNLGSSQTMMSYLMGLSANIVSHRDKPVWNGYSEDT